jgi:hypothetical protein
MSDVSRLKILVYGQEIEYKSAEDLGLSFQRIADNEADMSNKYGEFSYSFELPITKKNSEIFQYANARGRKNIFVPNRDLPCQVYFNESLLLDGVISLQEVTTTSYNCVLYSKLKEFADLIENKTLQDLQFPVITWDYEKSIINHINADYQSADETYWQFPLIYYGTNYAANNTYIGKKDYKNVYFHNEDYPHQQFYYILNNIYGETPNRFYHHQLPPAFYVASLLTQIFRDAGWTCGGQILNDNNFKRVVMLYAGDEDLYDRAISASETAYDDAGGILSTSGLTTPLYPAKLCPEMEQADFINGIINMWGLYPIVDVQNKNIKFVTYKELQGDSFNPYDVTNKVMKDSARFVFMENNNPSIIFDDAENFRVMGDNAVSTGSTLNMSTMKWKTINNQNLDGFFNRRGTTEEIEIPFSPPTVKKTFIYNDYDIAGNNDTAGYHILIQPLMSSQTPYEAEGRKFNKGSGYTYVFNTEGLLKFNGSPTLHYYYGKSHCNIVNKTAKNKISDYYYINIYTGTTQFRIPVTICSPFQLSSYRSVIDAYKAAPDDLLDSRKTISSTYLSTLWNMMGVSGGTYTGVTTDYSLVFDDSGYFHETLWSKFHKPKYDRFTKSEVLECQMKMRAYDWQEMQLNRPILYNGEIYHIIEISGYNPIEQVADLRLIKTL